MTIGRRTNEKSSSLLRFDGNANSGPPRLIVASRSSFPIDNALRIPSMSYYTPTRHHGHCRSPVQGSENTFMNVFAQDNSENGICKCISLILNQVRCQEMQWKDRSWGPVSNGRFSCRRSHGRQLNEEHSSSLRVPAEASLLLP